MRNETFRAMPGMIARSTEVVEVGSWRKAEQLSRTSSVEAKVLLRTPGLAAPLLLLVVATSGLAQRPQRLSQPGVSPGVWGVLELPRSAGPHPGVVIIPGSAGWRAFYPQLARALADSGFAALALDYYGDTGLDTSSADAAMKRPVWRASIRNAVAHLEESASAGRAVALMGFSRGGFLAMEVGASLPAVKAVVEYFGGGAADPDSLRQQVRGFPPLLILHGNADTIVHVTQAYRLRDAMLAHGGEVEVQIYPGANHGFYNSPAAMSDAARRSVEFLRRYLAARDTTRLR